MGTRLASLKVNITAQQSSHCECVGLGRIGWLLGYLPSGSNSSSGSSSSSNAAATAAATPPEPIPAASGATVAPAIPSLMVAPGRDWLRGNVVTVTTSFGEEMRGEVYAVDDVTRTVVLRESSHPAYPPAQTLEQPRTRTYSHTHTLIYAHGTH